MSKKPVPMSVILGKNKPTNWIQGMSVAQRKKQGITTVMPGDKDFGKFLDKDGHEENPILYNVGDVGVEVNHSHMNKLRILHMTMENWAHDDGKNHALDSAQGRLYEADLHKINELMERGTETMLESDTEFLGTSEFLTKEEMLDMNVLFKTYGGKRKNPNPW